MRGGKEDLESTRSLVCAGESVITKMGRKGSHDLALGLAAMHLVAPGVCRGIPGGSSSGRKAPIARAAWPCIRWCQFGGGALLGVA